MFIPALTSEGVPDPVVFTTDDLPPARRLDAWNAAFGSLNAITVPESKGGVLGTRCEGRPLSTGMMLSVTQVSPARFSRDPRRARRDDLDHWVLRVMRRGQSRLQHPGFTALLGPGEPLLFSMHETWETEWTEAEWVSLCIWRDLHPQLSAGLGAVPRGPLCGAGAGLLADLLLALPRRLAAAPAAEVPVLAEATRAAVAACLLASGPPPTAFVADLAKERVRQAVRRHIVSARLTPARLAAASGLSRSALYRMFEAEGGVAVYIRDVRLSFVHAALRDPAQAGRGIGEIAEAYGFPNHRPSRAPSAKFMASRRGAGRRTAGPGPAPAARVCLAAVAARRLRSSR